MTRKEFLWTLAVLAVTPFVAPIHALGRATARLEKSRAEWRALLPRDAYAVLFKESTERPGSSGLNDEKRPRQEERGLATDRKLVCEACQSLCK